MKRCFLVVDAIAISFQKEHSLQPTLPKNKSKMTSDSSKQIKQMVNFIMQEAHEKINEIRIKVKILSRISRHEKKKYICLT
jgi:hypothetical protein